MMLFWDSKMYRMACVINILTSTGSTKTTRIPSCAEDLIFRRKDP